MSDRQNRGLIQIGIGVLKTTVSAAQKRVYAQLGNYLVANGTAEADNVEWWQHVGFVSQPSNPTPAKAGCDSVVVRQGGIDAVIASQDARGLALAGSLKPGETCVYAPGADGSGQARALFKADGSINLYTRKGNTDSGAGMVFRMDAQAGSITMLNDQGYGMIIDSTGVRIFAGGSGSALTLNANGTCSLIGTGQCQMDGSTVLLGSIAVPVVNAVCVGPAGLVAVASAKVLCALA